MVGTGEWQGMVDGEALRRWRWAGQLSNVLLFLDDTQVLHADVKPGNIIVSQQATRLMLADFGLSMKLPAVVVGKHVPTRCYRCQELLAHTQKDAQLSRFSFGDLKCFTLSCEVSSWSEDIWSMMIHDAPCISMPRANVAQMKFRI